MSDQSGGSPCAGIMLALIVTVILAAVVLVLALVPQWQRLLSP